MKKLLIILFLLGLVVIANAQSTPYPGKTGYPISQSIGSDSAVVRGKGPLAGRMVLYRYTDTTAANLERIKNYPFALIGTTSDGLTWYRNPTATQWITTSGTGGGGDDITFINDSTIIICNGTGVCDTVSLGNTFNFYFLNDSTLVTCDTPIVIQVGDDFVTQQLCDTIHVPKQFIYKFQNGLQEISPGLVEFGAPVPADNFSALKKKTYLNQDFYSLNFGGKSTLEELINITQSQPVTSGILQLKRDVGNNVGLYFHRFDPFAPLGDSVGLMSWVNKGYAIVTNAGSNWYSVRVDDENAKQTGIFFHDRDTGNIDAVTIFGQQVPAGYGFANNPPPDTSFYNQRIAVFKTNHDVQFPNYPNTRNNGTTGIAFYPDADGNVRVGPTVGGSEITIINDTTITICSFGDMLCDTFITTVVNPIQLVTIINDSTLQVCDTLGNCDTLNIGSGGGASIDEKFFTPNQTSLGNTRHETNTWNFSVGNSLFISNSASNGFNFGKNSRINGGDLNTVFLNNNTVSGNENFVAGRNMVVSGNTNFAAATDGTVSNANYSATFGDANDQRGTASILTGFGNDNFTENGFTGGSDNVNGGTSPGVGTPNLYSNTFVYGLQNRVTGNRSFIGGQSITSTANNTTAFGTTMSLSTASSFNVGYDANVDFQITDDKVRINAAMFQEYKGADILSATDLVLGTDGNTFAVAGTTTIQDISTTNWQAGSVIRLLFNTVLTVKHNTGPNLGYAVILLAGSVDLTTDANTVLTLLYNGTEWEECSRKLAGSSIGGSITADNGLTANTATNVQLGNSVNGVNPLLHTSYIRTDAFSLNINTTTGGATPLVVQSTSGIAGSFTATGAGSGIYSESSSGFAVEALSTSSYAGAFFVNPSSTNTIVPVIKLDRRTSSTAANGIGGSLDFLIESDDFLAYTSNQLISKYTNADGPSNLISQLDITGLNNSATGTIASFYGSGVVGIGRSSSYVATRLDVLDASGSGVAMVNMSSSNTKTLNVVNTNSSNIPLYVTGGAAEAIHVESTGTQYLGRTTTALTNTSQVLMEIIHNSSGTAAAGFGSIINFDLSSATVAERTAAQIITKWVVATDATRTAQQDYYGVNSGSLNNVMSIYGGGVVGIGISSGYTGTRLEVVDNAVGAASIVKVTSTSTAANSNSQKGVDVLLSGANSNASQSTYGVYSANTHTNSGGGASFNYGVFGDASGGDVNRGVYGSGTSQGVYGLSGSGTGVFAVSTSGYGSQIQTTSGISALQTQVNPSSTNTVQNSIDILRGTSGTAADGIGTALSFQIEHDGGTITEVAKMNVQLATAASATRTSKFTFQGVTSASSFQDWLIIGQSGYLKLRPMTVTEAGAIATAEGLLVFVSNTDATFTSIGPWMYYNGAWHAL